MTEATTFSFMRADRCLQPHRIGPHAQRDLYLLICPSKVPVPVAVPAAKSIVCKLTIVNVPVAPANRPVPFSIVATSVILA